MCYAKPGPRCSGHTRKEYNSAVERHGADSPQAMKALDGWLRTPEGIKQLRSEGQHDLAQRFERERADAIKAYHQQQRAEALNASLDEVRDSLRDEFEVEYNRRYSDHFEGDYEVKDVKVERDASGEPVVAVEWEYVHGGSITSETNYQMIDGGVNDPIEYYHTAEHKTFEDEAEAINETGAFDVVDNAEESVARADEVLRTRLGSDVRITHTTAPAFDAETVREYWTSRINEESLIDDLDPDDEGDNKRLTLMETHALATDETKAAARARLAEQEED